VAVQPLDQTLVHRLGRHVPVLGHDRNPLAHAPDAIGDRHIEGLGDRSLSGTGGLHDVEVVQHLRPFGGHIELALAGTPCAQVVGRDRPMGPLSFRALVEVASAELVVDGHRYPLQPGMQVAGEIHLGTRTVLEYLVSPVKKAFHEAARER